MAAAAWEIGGHAGANGHLLLKELKALGISGGRVPPAAIALSKAGLSKKRKKK